MNFIKNLLVRLFSPLLNQGGFATVPGTPTTIDGMNAAALRRVAWATKLRDDSVRPSVFNTIKTEFEVTDDIITVLKPGVMLDVSNIGKAHKGGGQSIKMGLRKPLRKKARYGTGNAMLGFEDESDLLWVQLYYNEIKKAIKFNQWGYTFNDTEYLSFVSGYGQQFSTFMSENDDTRCQQALLFTLAEELIQAPVNQTQNLNKNWFIPNLAWASFPTWDVTPLPTRTDGVADADNFFSSRYYSGATTFAENVAIAMLAGSTTGSVSRALLNVGTLTSLKAYILDRHVVQPIMLDGRISWILKVSEMVAGWMQNPDNTGALGSYWKSVGEYIDKDRMIIPGEIGRLFGKLVVVEDLRTPTLTVGGSLGAYTLTPGFMQPGNNDDRNNSAWANTSGDTNYVFDVCMILGKNALAKYTRDDLVTDLAEATEYGQIQGRGAYKGEGIQICAYDKDSGSRTPITQIQRGSCMVPVSRTAIEAIVS